MLLLALFADGGVLGWIVAKSGSMGDLRASIFYLVMLLALAEALFVGIIHQARHADSTPRRQILSDLRSAEMGFYGSLALVCVALLLTDAFLSPCPDLVRKDVGALVFIIALWSGRYYSLWRRDRRLVDDSHSKE